MAKRQKNRFGTVDQLKSGNFRARYRLKSGEQVTAGTFPAEELAWQRLEEIEVELRHDEHWDGRKGKTKFKDFMVVYMAHREKHVTPTEFTNNRSYLKVHLLPAFGHLQMGQIDEETVDRWFDTMPRAEIRRNVYAFLRRAMRFAQKWKYIRSSPCNVFEPSKGVSVPRPDWRAADFNAVLAHIPESITLNNSPVLHKVYYREALEIMFAAHLRLGELIGLNANDFDRTTQKLNVERQRRANGDTADTKTGQHKRIRPLKRGLQAIDRLPRRIGTAPMIPGPRADRLTRSTLQRAWVAACEAAGYENFHIHDLRHIGLSLVAAAGMPMRDVMARGGHASIEAAMRYQHTDSDRDDAVADAVDRLLG